MTGRPFGEFTGPSSSDTTPDFTRPIMARLGFMQVTERVARRRRRRTRLIRAATVVSAFAFMAIGLQLHEIGPNTRRPTGPTIHSALRSDVGRTQQHLEGTIQTIRNIHTKLVPIRDTADTADTADPPETGETWGAPARRPLGPAGVPGLIQPRSRDRQEPDEPDEPQRGRFEPFNADVEYSGIGPMRWL